MAVTIDGNDVRIPGTIRHANSFRPAIASGQLAQRNLQEDVIDLTACRVPLARAANAAGVGITGTADSYVTSVEKTGSIITTTILIEVDGLNSGGTINDIVGADGAGVAHLGQITAAVNGTIFAGKIECLEAPTGGNSDIDLWYADEATGVEDTLITALTNDTQCINHGAWSAGDMDVLTAFPAANKYLYLATGAATDATYTAGILLITLYGKGATDELSVVDGTLGTNAPSLQTENLQDVGATTRYARFLVRLPSEYVGSETVQLRFAAGMLTNPADVSATLDVECYKSDEDNTVSLDLCETAAQSMNSTTFADLDFTITSTVLSPGDMLDVRIAVAVNDAATGAAVIGCVAAIKRLCDTQG
jgi:hypothetical protein